MYYLETILNNAHPFWIISPAEVILYALSGVVCLGAFVVAIWAVLASRL